MLSKSLKLLGAAASIAALLLVGACGKTAKPDDAPKADATPVAKVEKATPVAPVAPAMKSEAVPAPKARIVEESSPPPVKSSKKGKAKKGKAKKGKAKKGKAKKGKAKKGKKYAAKKAKAKKAKAARVPVAAPAATPAQ
jgi:hypothetical protein